MANRIVRRRSQSVVVGARRRESVWFSSAIAATTLGSGSVILYSLNAAALAFRPFTIIRTILDIAIRSDQAAAVEVQSVAIGKAVVSDQAAAVGVTAVPTPVTDVGSDLWFLHQTMFAEESALTDRAKPHGLWHIESRAMRKVLDGQTMLTILEVNGATGQGAIIRTMGRFLIKAN